MSVSTTPIHICTPSLQAPSATPHALTSLWLALGHLVDLLALTPVTPWGPTDQMAMRVHFRDHVDLFVSYGSNFGSIPACLHRHGTLTITEVDVLLCALDDEDEDPDFEFIPLYGFDLADIVGCGNLRCGGMPGSWEQILDVAERWLLHGGFLFGLRCPYDVIEVPRRPDA